MRRRVIEGPDGIVGLIEDSDTNAITLIEPGDLVEREVKTDAEWRNAKKDYVADIVRRRQNDVVKNPPARDNLKA